jgi:hypothetical protein
MTMSPRNRIILAYLLLLLFTVAHQFEKAWVGFWISKVLGLLCKSNLRSLYDCQRGRPHNTNAGTGKYFDCAAGAVSGVALIIVGPILTYLLIKRVRNGD